MRSPHWNRPTAQGTADARAAVLDEEQEQAVPIAPKRKSKTKSAADKPQKAKAKVSHGSSVCISYVCHIIYVSSAGLYNFVIVLFHPLSTLLYVQSRLSWEMTCAGSQAAACCTAGPSCKHCLATTCSTTAVAWTSSRHVLIHRSLSSCRRHAPAAHVKSASS